MALAEEIRDVSPARGAGARLALDIDVGRVLEGTAVLLLLFINVYGIVRFGSIDFEANVWRPGQAVLHGQSPYPPNDIAALIKPTYLYPPLLLLLDAPLVLLGHDVARVVFWLLEAGAVLGALRLLDVTDRRVYLWGGLAFPVLTGLGLGNPTLFLLPMLAGAWRWRDRWWVVGLVVGVAGAFKLIVWPLGVWLIATGRLRSAALAAATAVALVLVPWALIGFASLGDYPSMLSTFSSRSGAPHAFTLTVLLGKLGTPDVLAQGLRWAAGGAVLAGLAVVARRGALGDRRAFALAVLSVLVISPVVERVYLALLLVPLALARPRFDGAWKGLWVLWLTFVLPTGPVHSIVDHGRVLTSAGHVPTLVELVMVLGVLAVVAVASLRGDDGEALAWPR